MHQSPYKRECTLGTSTVTFQLHLMPLGPALWEIDLHGWLHLPIPAIYAVTAELLQSLGWLGPVVGGLDRECGVL